VKAASIPLVILEAHSRENRHRENAGIIFCGNGGTNEKALGAGA